MLEATRIRSGMLRRRREGREDRHLAVVSGDEPGLDATGLDEPGLDATGLDEPGLDEPGLDGTPDGPGTVSATPGREVIEAALARHPAGQGRRHASLPTPRDPVGDDDRHPVSFADRVRVASGVSAETAVEDPLTGLATPAYLNVRLGEIYREAAILGAPAGHRHVLVVFDVVGAALDPWERAARLLEAAAVLRLVWPGGETLVVLGPTRLAALVARTPSVVETAEGAAELVEANIGRASEGQSAVRVALHVIDLPERADTARSTVVRLSG